MTTDGKAPMGMNASATTAAPPLIQRLVRDHGADWVDEHSVVAWSERGGDGVVLFSGDPTRFPEGQDVAAVLPELLREFDTPVRIAVVRVADEDALARRYGVRRWPTLLFLRDGRYVTALAGMHDWDVFVQRFGDALSSPTRRPPTIGIPVVAQ